MEDNKARKLLKVILKSLIQQEQEMEELSKYLSANIHLIQISIDSKEIIPIAEIAEILDMQEDKDYELLATQLFNIVDCKENINSKLENFLNDYGI